MAINSDAENQPIVDEESPLLVNHQPEQQLDQPENSPKPTSFYVWRIVWVTLAALLIGVFIKGWIEGSDYANVGLTTRPQFIQLTSAS